MDDATSLYSVIFENFPDGIILADRENKILFVNAAAERIRRISRKDKIGKNILDCHPEASREKVKRALSYIHEKKIPFQRMVVDSVSDRIYENSYRVIENADGSVLGTMVISKDITDKQKAELERLRFNQRLQLEITSLSDRLNSLFLESLASLVNTLEAKDVYTRGHSERVTGVSKKFVLSVFGSTQLLSDIELAARLHDIGKIGINEAILNKPGKLTDEEMALMRKHPEITAQILSPFANLKEVTNIAKHHHERFDGKGYPDALAGDSIPIGSRILALADTYDAMTSSRPYREALSLDVAIKIIKENFGTQFDPELGTSFIELIETGTI